MKGKVENRSGMVVLKDYVYGLVDHSLETSSAVMTELLFSCITSLQGVVEFVQQHLICVSSKKIFIQHDTDINGIGIT